MIKKADSMIIDLNEKEQGGKGQVEIKHVYEPEELTGKLKLCALISLNPGCSIGYHQHFDEDEIFYVIRGKGIIIDNGIEEQIAIGDGHLLRGGQFHSIENTGEELLEVMAIILPYVYEHEINSF